MEIGATSTLSAMMQELYARQDATAQAPQAPSQVEAEADQVTEVREPTDSGGPTDDQGRGRNLDTTA